MAEGGGDGSRVVEAGGIGFMVAVEDPTKMVEAGGSCGGGLADMV